MAKDILGELGVSPFKPTQTQGKPRDILGDLTYPEVPDATFETPLLGKVTIKPKTQEEKIGEFLQGSQKVIDTIGAPADAISDFLLPMATLPVAGVGALGSLALPAGEDQTKVDRAAEIAQIVAALGQSGNPKAEAILKPVHWAMDKTIGAAGRTVGNTLVDKLVAAGIDPEIAAGFAATGDAVTQVGVTAGAVKGAGIIKNSTPIRLLRIKERGLTTSAPPNKLYSSRFDYLRDQNPDLTLGQFLRKHPEFKEQAFAERATPEQSTKKTTPTEEAPIKESPVVDESLTISPEKQAEFFKLADEHFGYENIPPTHAIFESMTPDELLTLAQKYDNKGKAPKEKRKPGRPKTKTEEASTPKPKKQEDFSSLADSQKEFVRNKVKELGSYEAVKLHYNTKSTIQKYAFSLAEELFGEGEVAVDSVVTPKRSPERQVTEETPTPVESAEEVAESGEGATPTVAPIKGAVPDIAPEEAAEAYALAKDRLSQLDVDDPKNADEVAKLSIMIDQYGQIMSGEKKAKDFAPEEIVAKSPEPETGPTRLDQERERVLGTPEERTAQQREFEENKAKLEKIVKGQDDSFGKNLTEGKKVKLYRGTTSGGLEGREGYAMFASSSRPVAQSYAPHTSKNDLTDGEVIEFEVDLSDKEVIEFPVTKAKFGKGNDFDKFKFDEQAQQLKEGQVLVARNVYDSGPRASTLEDPEKLYSHPSDIYAFPSKKTSARGEVKSFESLEVAEEDYSLNPRSFTSLEKAQKFAQTRGLEVLQIGKKYHVGRDLLDEDISVDNVKDLSELEKEAEREVEAELAEQKKHAAEKVETIKVTQPFQKIGDAYISTVDEVISTTRSLLPAIKITGTGEVIKGKKNDTHQDIYLPKFPDAEKVPKFTVGFVDSAGNYLDRVQAIEKIIEEDSELFSQLLRTRSPYNHRKDTTKGEWLHNGLDSFSYALALEKLPSQARSVGIIKNEAKEWEAFLGTAQEIQAGIAESIGSFKTLAKARKALGDTKGVKAPKPVTAEEVKAYLKAEIAKHKESELQRLIKEQEEDAALDEVNVESWEEMREKEENDALQDYDEDGYFQDRNIGDVTKDVYKAFFDDERGSINPEIRNPEDMKDIAEARKRLRKDIKKLISVGNKIFYHGTSINFDQFDTPAWFTSDANTAAIYAGRGEAPNIRPVVLDVKNPYTVNEFEELENVSKGMMKALQMAGHDGLKHVAPDGTETVVAFEESSIQSIFDRLSKLSSKLLKNETGAINAKGSSTLRAIHELSESLKKAYNYVRNAAKAIKDWALTKKQYNPKAHFSPRENEYRANVLKNTTSRASKALKTSTDESVVGLLKFMESRQRIVPMHDGKSVEIPLRQLPMVSKKFPHLRSGYNSMPKGGSMRSPSHIFSTIFDYESNPVIDAMESTVALAVNMRNSESWLKTLLRDIPDSTHAVKKTLEPIYEKVAPLVEAKDRTSRKIQRNQDRLSVTRDQAERKKLWAKGQQLRKLWKKQDRKLREELITRYDSEIFNLAKEHADVRILLQAGEQLPEGIELSQTEVAISEKIREYLDRTKEDLKGLDIPVKEAAPYMHRVLPDLLQDEGAQGFMQNSGKVPTYMKFAHQSEVGRLWYPSAHITMGAYVPLVERKLAFQPFLDRWAEAIDNMPADIQQYMDQWVNDNLRRKPYTALEKFANGLVAFEYARIIGGSLSVAFKHATKIADNLAQYDTITNTKAVNATIRAVAQNAKKSLGLKGRDAEIRLIKAFVMQKGLVSMLDETPGMNTLWDKAKFWLAAPTMATEFFDNGVSVIATTLAASSHKFTYEQATRLIWETILNANFRGGWDQPPFYKKTPGRIVGMFQMTPWKLWEFRFRLLNKAIKGEKDNFGTPFSTQLIRYILMFGMAEAIFRLFDTSIIDQVSHFPFLGHFIGADKKTGYHLEEPTAAQSPILGLITEMAEKGIVSGATDHFISLPQFEKAWRVMHEEYPKNYYNDPAAYLFGIHKVKSGKGKSGSRGRGGRGSSRSSRSSR